MLTVLFSTLQKALTHGGNVYMLRVLPCSCGRERESSESLNRSGLYN